MPNYFVPSNYFINWASGAIADMKRNIGCAWKNEEFFFKKGITFSVSGQYAPTFRLNSSAVFEAKGSCIFSDIIETEALLGVLCSKLSKYLLKTFIKHTVDCSGDDINSLVLPLVQDPRISRKVSSIISQQARKPRYDYASNEQLEIDRLVYEAYGLNEDDIQEVENWYARRYPKLAKAQRRALAAKQGKTEEELVERPRFHLYCDESRHLPYDGESCFLLGLLSCPAEKVKAAHAELSDLWKAHSLPPHFESKWTKVSPGKLDFYKALVDWFFNAEWVSFRALILPDKQRLYAALPAESRDYLYYRLYYQLLRGAIEPENRYRVFMDLKDTRGREKRKQLEQLLHQDADDDDGKIVENLQHVQSHHVRLLQVCDLLLGAAGFAWREQQMNESTAKRALVSAIEEKLGQFLTTDTPPGTEKINLLTWHDKEALLL